MRNCRCHIFATQCLLYNTPRIVYHPSISYHPCFLHSHILCALRSQRGLQNLHQLLLHLHPVIDHALDSEILHELLVGQPLVGAGRQVAGLEPLLDGLTLVGAAVRCHHWFSHHLLGARQGRSTAQGDMRHGTACRNASAALVWC